MNYTLKPKEFFRKFGEAWMKMVDLNYAPGELFCPCRDCQIEYIQASRSAASTAKFSFITLITTFWTVFYMMTRAD